MMFLKHIHVFRSASIMGCTNASFSKGLSNSVYAHSWKPYSNRSRSHTAGQNEGTRAGLPVSTEKFLKSGVRKVFEEKRCLTTMSGKGPGLIVFDLDCTLWPHHVDTTVNPPFIQTNSKVVDQDGVTITYYPEVPKVLEYLQSEGYSIGAASRTTKPPAAEQLLNFFDWNKFFKYKEIYPGSKVTHFAKFVEQTHVPHHEMLFFDDEQRNITDMEKEGVKCVLVENGVNLQLVKDSIEKFRNGLL